MQQRLRRHRHGLGGLLRPHHPRRNDARHDGARNPAQNQGNPPDDPRHHGDQERGGEHHGQGRRLENRRLPHQAREPQSSTPLHQKERPFATIGHRTDHSRLPVGVRAHLRIVADGRNVPRLVFALPQNHLVGNRTGILDRPKHQRNSALPENRGQSGVLQVRAPELLQLDQPPVGRHAGDVAHTDALENLSRCRRPCEDDTAAHRQFPLRPMAVDFVAAARILRCGG